MGIPARLRQRLMPQGKSETAKKLAAKPS